MKYTDCLHKLTISGVGRNLSRGGWFPSQKYDYQKWFWSWAENFFKLIPK